MNRYVFPTSDGRYVAVNAGENGEFRGLCEAVERLDLADRADLQTRAARNERRAEIDTEIAAAIVGRPLDDVAARFERFDVPYAPVLAPRDVFDDPQVRELGVVHDGEQPFAELPIFGVTRRSLTHVPALDEDGAAVRDGGWAALAEEP